MMEDSRVLDDILVAMKNMNLIIIFYIAMIMAYSLSGYIQENSSYEFLAKINCMPVAAWKMIALIGSGLSNKEIAGKLNLSEGTVRNNLSIILSKLNLRARTQLAIWAVQTGAVNKHFGDER